MFLDGNNRLVFSLLSHQNCQTPMGIQLLSPLFYISFGFYSAQRETKQKQKNGKKKFGILGGRVRDEGGICCFVLLGEEFKGNLKRFAESSFSLWTTAHV